MITVTLTAECPDHPEYLGVRRRRTNASWCYGCDSVYEVRHPADVFEANVTLKEVTNVS